jgi:hypothetical protein
MFTNPAPHDDELSDTIVLAEQEAAAALLREAGWIVFPPSGVSYGCFCELGTCDPGTEPDGCVIDENRNSDCIYADAVGRKEACKYWKAWTPETLNVFWKGVG